MSDSDRRDDIEMSQGNWSILLGLVSGLLSQFFPPPPIRDDEYYTRGEVIRRCKISPNTFVAWESAGLKTLSAGRMFVYGRDLGDFLRSNPILPKAKKRKG